MQTHSQHSQRVSQSSDKKLETGFSFQQTQHQIFDDGIQFIPICGVSIEYQLKYSELIPSSIFWNHMEIYMEKHPYDELIETVADKMQEYEEWPSGVRRGLVHGILDLLILAKITPWR